MKKNLRKNCSLTLKHSFALCHTAKALTVVIKTITESETSISSLRVRSNKLVSHSNICPNQSAPSWNHKQEKQKWEWHHSIPDINIVHLRSAANLFIYKKTLILPTRILVQYTKGIHNTKKKNLFSVVINFHASCLHFLIRSPKCIATAHKHCSSKEPKGIF